MEDIVRKEVLLRTATIVNIVAQSACTVFRSFLNTDKKRPFREYSVLCSGKQREENVIKSI